MSPTEKRGRRHSSTVTVVVLDSAPTSTFSLSKADVKEEYYRASGKGGQNRNKVETAVRLVHIPTGTVAIAADERSQWKNRQLAWGRLEEKLKAETLASSHAKVNDERSDYFGKGRSWSWTEWRDEVKSPSGRKYSMKKLLSGRFDRVEA